MFDFTTRDSWLRYVGSPAAQQAVGIQAAGRQNYNLRGPVSKHSNVRSMLTIYELGLLYALARDHWKGRGGIIDAGPLLGASTFAFGLGLTHNGIAHPQEREASIYSYDLWIADDYYKGFMGAERRPKTPSLLHEFNKINRDFADFIVPHQGDFRSWSWSEAPIEILFMDLAKTWELNGHYVRTMLPHLIEDAALIQQDYVHFNEYWIHITMEYFVDHFEFVDAIYGATAYFRVKTPLTAAECAIDLRAMPYIEKMNLLERARSRMPAGVQEVMKCAAAKCAGEHGDFPKAKELLESVDLTPNTDPVYNFSGIATSNKAVVEKMLADAAKKAATAA